MKFANLTMSICLTGGPRPVTVTRTPFSPNSFSAAQTSPPAALSTSSQAICMKMQLQAGNNTIVLPGAYLTGFSGPYYFILVPPSASTNSKSLRGATTDQGVYLVPNVPLVFAFPPNPTPMFIWSGAAELCDVMFI